MPRQYKKRTAHRWRLGAVFGACLALALGSFYIVQLMNVADMEALSDAQRGEPDYIVEKFSAVRMNPDGKPRYIVAGDKLSHLPLTDSSTVEKPLVQSFAEDKPPMFITSDTAKLDHINNTVELLGNVDIRRAGSGNARPMTMDTEALTIFADTDQMRTSHPVEMSSGGSVFRGSSMTANNATRQITLHNARGELPAK